uniref:Uncharacterized protein n=1 Tax=Ditylenchus dipsaci TaxID=166011 RepID=A0A915DKN6_9BILA
MYLICLLSCGSNSRSGGGSRYANEVLDLPALVVMPLLVLYFTHYSLIGLECALLAVPTNGAGVPGVSGLAALIQSLVVLLLSVLSILTQVPLPAVWGLIPAGLVNTIPTDLNAIIAALPIVGGVQLPPINVPNLPNVSVLVSLLQALIAVVLSLLSTLLQAPLPALSGIIPNGLVGTIPATLDAVLKSLPIVGGLLGAISFAIPHKEQYDCGISSSGIPHVANRVVNGGILARVTILGIAYHHPKNILKMFE